MGGGKDRAATNAMIEDQRRRSEQENADFMRRTNADWDQARGRNQDMYNSMFGGFNSFASGERDFTGGGGVGGGGGDGGAGADTRFGDVEGSYRNFMGGGGVDTGRFGAFQGHLMDIAGNGGWSPERIASMDQNISGFKDIARTGGVDAEGINRMRGAGVFDEYAKTGGYSDRDISNIRARASSIIPAYYDTARQEAGRKAAVQGGYGPGQSALFSRLARQQSGAAAEASREAELGIRDRIDAGRQWGSGALAEAEGGLQSLLSQNRLSALTGASNVEANMLNSIAQNRTGAASAGGGNEIGMQGLIQKGKMFGTQGLEGMAESAAARGRAAASDAAADARWRAEFDREGRMYGLEGMKSLYGTTPAETAMYINANLGGRGLMYENENALRTSRMGNRRQGTDWGKIAGVAGTVALAASDRNLKTDIKPLTTKNIIDAFKEIEISTWRYRGDVTGTLHLGPMAQDMKTVFGVGDGKTIAMVDVMGLMMLLGKALAEKAGE